MARRHAALMAALMFSALAPRAMASEARWRVGGEIPVWIERPNVPVWQREMVQRAVMAWDAAATGAFRLVEIEEFPSRGIRIRFVREDHDFGEAMPYYDRRTNEIVRADVVLDMDTPGDGLQKRLVLYLTALHEVGHALGLPHSDDFGSIMYRFRGPADPDRYFLAYRRKLRSEDDIGRSGATGLSERDLGALWGLYGTGGVRPPGAGR